MSKKTFTIIDDGKRHILPIEDIGKYCKDNPSSIFDTIIENGIKVWKNFYCEHCGERIPWKKIHYKNGISKYIQGHQNIGRVLLKEQKRKIAKSMTGKRKSAYSLIKYSFSRLISDSIRKGEI